MINIGQKRFSVIMPTRERLAGLQTTLNSFRDTTDNLNALEVILVCDKEDPTLEKVLVLANEYPFTIKIFVRDRSERFCRDYYEWAIPKTRGTNIWAFNDDAYILTPHWDTLVLKAVGDKKVYLLDVWDSTHEDNGQSFPRFPIVSRKAVNAVGWLYHPTITMWGADTILYQTYKEAGCVIPCHEVQLQHDHMPSKRFADMYEEDKKNGVFPVPVLNDIEALKKAIRLEECEALIRTHDSAQWEAWVQKQHAQGVSYDEQRALVKQATENVTKEERDGSGSAA